MEISDDRSQWEKHLSYCFKESTGKIGGNYDFTIMDNTKRFIITVIPSFVLVDKAKLLLSQYSKACQGDDEEQIQNVQFEIEDMIFDAG